MQHEVHRCSGLLVLLLHLAAAQAWSVGPTARLHISGTHEAQAAILQARSVPGCEDGVQWSPKVYHPSAFEAAFLRSLAGSDAGACAFVRGSTTEVDQWLAVVKDHNNLDYPLEGSAFAADVPRRHEAALDGLGNQVFSKFVLTSTCPGELAGLTKELYVEPLVGHLRHPRALGPCIAEQRKAASSAIELGYQLINPWPAADFHLAYPGKRYLLDCGSSTFGSSLQYLTTRYRQAGIGFDEIWAWEMQATDPAGYWNAVPSVFKPRLHFYNTAITSDFADASHPLNIIRSIYRPGDFIAFKLDIDNSPLETAIMAEIEDDRGLIAAIGEMFHEQHYDHAEMAPYFGSSNNATLLDVVASFSRLRAKGLLLHYWP